MQEAPPDDFVSEFSAIRASQAPGRELRGIKAETIGRHELSFKTSPMSPQSSHSSRPTTPRRPSGGSANLSLISPPPALSHQSSTSIDSFTQDSVQSQKEVESQYISQRRSIPAYPIPRSCTHRDDIEVSHMNSSSEAVTDTGDSTPFDVDIATFNGEAYDFNLPHAITTPDDAAHTLRPPPFGMVKTGLSRVIEEDEHSEGRRSSTTTLTKRPSTANSSLRHVKSFPSTCQQLEESHESMKETYRGNTQPSPKKHARFTRIIQPSFDDAVCDVPVTRHSQRSSTTVKDAEGSWEDLVDWCYEHNAEADCNFDFARAMSPSPETRMDTPEIADDNTSSLHPLDRGLYSNAFNARRPSSVYSTSPSAFLPMQTSLPDLEPTSAISTHSSFDSVSEAVTPAESVTDLLPQGFSQSHPKAHVSKPIGLHSPHVSNDLTSQEMYEYLCQEMYTRDSYQYGRVDGSTLSSASRRSSRSRISKSSSQESFCVRRYTNSSSAGSLPDLVPSRISREKTEAFPDQLTQQMAAFGTSEEQQALAGRRRSPSSLVKDVAQKKLLSRMQSGCVDDATNTEVLLPLHPALRDRAGSDAAFRDFGVLLPSTRMRSVSSASSLNGVNISPSASRASYGLYPKPTVRGGCN
ncbi:MAG: hypothetical protein Q9217_006422 [Psora testacea]